MQEKNILEQLEGNTQSSPNKGGNELFFALNDIANIFGTKETIATPESKEQQGVFLQNLNILIFLHSRRGKILANMSRKNPGNTASKIQEFLSQGKRFINKIKANDDTASQELLDENKELTPLLQNPNEIYEKLLLEEKYPLENGEWEVGNGELISSLQFETINSELKRRNISKQEHSKWISLIELTFKQKPKQMLDLFLDNFGFLPEELYTKLAFNNLNFDTIADFHTLLRKKEETLKRNKASHIQITQIRNIRALFLKHIFLDKKGKKNKTIPGICEVANNQSGLQVTPDINGIWIKIFKGKKSIVSHIPYAYCDQQLIEHWEANGWINENDFLEISKQNSLENSKKSQADDLERIQIENLATLTNCKDNSKEEIIDLLLTEPVKIAKILTEHRLTLPSSIIKEAINSTNDKKETLQKLFVVAESITSAMSHEVLFDHQEMTYSYELAYRTRNARQKRMKYLNNDPRYYNILLIIQEIFASSLPENNLKEGFMMFYGRYSTKDQSQIFIELVKDFQVSRILIGEEKHLPKHLRQALSNMPALEQDKFENLELMIKSAKFAQKNLSKIKGEIGNLDIKGKKNFPIYENIIKRIQDITVFVLNYLPDQYREFMSISDQLNSLSSIKELDINKFIDIVNNFISLAEGSFVEIENNIDQYVSKGQVDNNLDFQIKTSKLEFNQDFLDKIERTGLKERQYDKKLASSGKSIKIAHINALETTSVNYLAESKAINELNLKEKKPLIVVSGGCKKASEEDLETFNKLNEILVKVGDKKKANISIPCTQSGIGNSLSESYLNYQDLTVGIQDNEKMRMFALAPAHAMFTEEGKSGNEIYAPSTVDQIFLPCSADWDRNDESILKAGYFQFISGAESVYNRLDKGKKRVHIIGNGGLFTIAEINDAMKNGVQALLVKGTGRFADMASIGIEHIDEMYMILGEKSELKTIGDYHEYYDMMKQIIEKHAPEDDYTEWLRKDWGENTTLDEDMANTEINGFDDYFRILGGKNGLTHKHLLYRQYLENFFNLSLNSYNLPIVSDVDELENYLNKLL